MYKDDYNFPEFMNTAAFWVRNIDNPNEIIKTLDDIKSFNNDIKFKLSCLFFLDKEEEVISSKDLLVYIASYNLPSKNMYDSKGQLINKSFYDRIIINLNLSEIKPINSIRYGITVRKTDIRSFPTKDSVHFTIEDSKINNFDRFQKTGCFAFEPLLILHESLDKQWYFVKLYNYIGWAKASDIALVKKKSEIFNYVSCENFITVTGKEVTIIVEEESSKTAMSVGMGTKLGLLESHKANKPDSLTVKIPARDSIGNLYFKKAYVSRNEDIIKGYMPYTKYNIINQALKYLDTTYDWGDKFQGKDCSSFILTIFRCFGFLLPRDANQQENSFTDINNLVIFNETEDIKIRYQKMNELKPGAALFMKGHVMMYLGKFKGNYYMIHSFLGYSIKKGSSYEARTALCVGISPVNMLTASGTPFINSFTSALHFL